MNRGGPGRRRDTEDEQSREVVCHRSLGGLKPTSVGDRVNGPGVENKAVYVRKFEWRRSPHLPGYVG